MSIAASSISASSKKSATRAALQGRPAALPRNAPARIAAAAGPKTAAHKPAAQAKDRPATAECAANPAPANASAALGKRKTDFNPRLHSAFRIPHSAFAMADYVP